MSGTKTITQQVRRGEVIEVTIPETKLVVDASIVDGRVRVSITHCGNAVVGKPRKPPPIETNLDQSNHIADIQS